MSLVSSVNLNNMTKNRIRVTSLSGWVTEILLLHRMTKVYQNYRFFWCIANFLLDTFSTSDTQFDLWSFLVHLYPDFQIQLFTPNKLCFDKVSPRLYLRLGRHWSSRDLHRQAARDCTSHRRNQHLYRENERDWRCGRKPDCVWGWCCRGPMQGGSPKIVIGIKFNPGRQWWATNSCEQRRSPRSCWDRQQKAWTQMQSTGLCRLHQRLCFLAMDWVCDQGKRRNGLL